MPKWIWDMLQIDDDNAGNTHHTSKQKLTPISCYDRNGCGDLKLINWRRTLQQQRKITMNIWPVKRESMNLLLQRRMN